MTARLDALMAAAVASGLLPLLPVVLPLTGMLGALAIGGRAGAGVALAAVALTAAAIGVLVVAVAGGVVPLALDLGGWAPPLGIALRADGLAAAVLAVSAVVMAAVAVEARAAFRAPATGESRVGQAVWPLMLALWAALAAVTLAGDLFTLHVAIELLTFAAVPLLCLDGRPATLQAALRYLLFALLGSMLYLAGIVLLYGLHGTLDIAQLALAVEADWPTVIAAALMTAGLIAKTALVPLHLWLPPAHAGAPPVVSALLSGLVVKGGFIVLLRLWFEVMPGLATGPFVALMGGLGVAAIVLGSLVALRQTRLKALVAHSTVAQVGYLFVVFPLAFDAGAGHLEAGVALAGGVVQLVGHAAAKAALFLAVGAVVARAGSDALATVRGAGRRMPLAVLGVALALLALAGLPPGGSWTGKALGLPGAAEPWATALSVAGALTAGYLMHALAVLLLPSAQVSGVQVSWRGAPAVGLAAAALLLGLMPLAALLPAAGEAPVRIDGAAMVEALGLLAAGAGLAALLGEAGVPDTGTTRAARAARALRGACRAAVAPAPWLDAQLARWSVASLALIALLAALVATLASDLA